MTEIGTRDISQLNWDVLVTPGIPIATTDLPPEMKQAMFQAIASTLIYGKRDAVLVDAYMISTIITTYLLCISLYFNICGRYVKT